MTTEVSRALLFDPHDKLNIKLHPLLVNGKGQLTVSTCNQPQQLDINKHMMLPQRKYPCQCTTCVSAPTSDNIPLPQQSTSNIAICQRATPEVSHIGIHQYVLGTTTNHYNRHQWDVTDLSFTVDLSHLLINRLVIMPATIHHFGQPQPCFCLCGYSTEK